MNKEINQKISQFLDDELTPTELDDFLLKIKKQPELKSTISRYQVMTQVMKKEHHVMANTDFLDSINQRLIQEPHHFLPKKKLEKSQNSFWQKTSLAIAASVACVAVIMSQQGQIQSGTQSMEQLAAVQQPVSQEEKIITAPIQVVVNRTQISQHERLKAYLRAHNDDLYTHGSLNMHPLAQVVSYGQE